MNDKPLVLIVGGGFGGLAVAKALRKAPVQVMVIDRQNHHVFQPLLYQVATASLSPAEISSPIRAVLKGQKNASVVLAEVLGVDVEERKVILARGTASYDYLVLAAGAKHDYFGHDEWAEFAPGLKTLSDATEIRRRILLAFEAAEHEADEQSRRSALTFVVVGAGPTGVELAGAIKAIASTTLPREYRHIDTATTRVVLVEGTDRILRSFPSELSERAQRDLEHLGVEVRLNSFVTDVSEKGVSVGDESIGAHNVLWAAGVRSNPLGGGLGAPCDRAGRVIVGPDLSLPNHPEVFVIGDMASATSEGASEPIPGVAQGAMQMGDYVGRVIANETAGNASARSKPFRYRDKGSMAIVGRNRAVAVVGKLRLGGMIAWLLWTTIHIAFIVSLRNRVRVLLGWCFNWLIGSRDARLIIGDARIQLTTPQGPGFEAFEPTEPPRDQTKVERREVERPFDA